MADEKIIMASVVGLTDDFKMVTVELIKNGEPLGWIAYTPEQLDHHIRALEKYKSLIRIDQARLKPAV